MLLGDILQRLHDHLVVVNGQIGFFEHRRDFVLAGRDLVVPGLGRNAQLVKLFLHVVHEGRNPLPNAAEILVFQLLTFGRRRADHGPAAQHQVLTLIVVIHVDQKILLLDSEVDLDFFHAFCPQQFQHPHRALVQGAQRPQKRRFLVQHLARVGNEGGRNAKGRGNPVALDEGGRRHVPGRVAARLKGRPDAAGGERRGVRLPLHQLLAGKPLDHGAGAAGIGKGVVLFGGGARHGLKPVRKVGRALFQRPFLHGMGNDIGGLFVQRFAFIDRLHQFFKNVFGKLLFNDRVAEGVLAEILRDGNELFLFDYVMSFRRKRRLHLFHGFAILLQEMLLFTPKAEFAQASGNALFAILSRPAGIFTDDRLPPENRSSSG